MWDASLLWLRSKNDQPMDTTFLTALRGVVWHTGKVLACGAVGPRFKPRQGQGDFVGPILFWIRMAHYSSGEAGWFSAPTLSFHQCS